MSGRGVLASLLLCAGCAASEPGTDAPDLVGTVWRWTALRGAESLDVARPRHYTLELLPGGHYRLRADCKRGSGRWSRDGERLTLAAGPMTRAACPPASLADRYVALLGGELQPSVDGHELTLRRDGDAALTFRAGRTRPLPGTRWLVRSFDNGAGVVITPFEETTLTASFAADGRLSGSGGCNRYDARFEVDGDALRIDTLAHTEKQCREPDDGMRQEAMFLAALARTAAHELRGERLRLLTAEGSLAVELVAAVTGSVAAPGGALPPDARVAVRLEDASGADASATLLGQAVFPTGGRRAPLPFEIVFDAADVDPTRPYSVRALVTGADGRPLFTTPRPSPVLTREAPQFDVTLALDPTG